MSSSPRHNATWVSRITSYVYSVQLLRYLLSKQNDGKTAESQSVTSSGSLVASPSISAADEDAEEGSRVVSSCKGSGQRVGSIQIMALDASKSYRLLYRDWNGNSSSIRIRRSLFVLMNEANQNAKQQMALHRPDPAAPVVKRPLLAAASKPHRFQR